MSGLCSEEHCGNVAVGDEDALVYWNVFNDEVFEIVVDSSMAHNVEKLRYDPWARESPRVHCKQQCKLARHSCHGASSVWFYSGWCGKTLSGAVFVKIKGPVETS